MCNAVNLQAVALQGAALGEGLLAEIALGGPHTYKWDLLALVCRAAHLRVIYVSTFVGPHTYELDLLSTRAAHLWVGYVTTWRAAHLHVRFVTTFVFHVFQASCKEVNWVWASLLFWFKISLEKLDKPFAKNNHRQLYTMFLASLVGLAQKCRTSPTLPVCVRVCRFRSKVSLNPLPQKVQRYRFTSLWHFMCRLSSRCSVNVFWHTLCGKER